MSQAINGSLGKFEVADLLEVAGINTSSICSVAILTFWLSLIALNVSIKHYN